MASSFVRRLLTRSFRGWMRSLSSSTQVRPSIVNGNTNALDIGTFSWRGYDKTSGHSAKGWTSTWSFATAGLAAIFSTTLAGQSACCHSEEVEVRKPKVVFVLGGPGSGKGTQCAKIVETYGFTHLSAGDLLREEIKSGSKDGIMIQNMIKEGKIVPSEVTVKLLQKAMRESDNDKFLIDGFPRNEENRGAFEAVTGIKPSFVLFLDCPEEETEKRLLSRSQGRIDDNVETIKKRFKVFVESSIPVMRHYEKRGKLQMVNAARPIEEVFGSIKPLFVPFVEEDVLQSTKDLLTSIDAKDFDTYNKLCDSALTAFEPESEGHLVEGLEFHRIFFVAGTATSTSKLETSEISSPKVVLLGDDTAIVTYTRLCQKVSFTGGVKVKAFNETRIWRRTKDDAGKFVWKNIHFHRSKA